MTNRARKKKKREMKIRGWLFVILLVSALSVFCYAIWHLTQYGFTSTMVICGCLIIPLMAIAGVVGGPVLMALTPKQGRGANGTRLS